jgi:hypothetical protein
MCQAFLDVRRGCGIDRAPVFIATHNRLSNFEVFFYGEVERMNLQKSLERIIELFGIFHLQVRSYNKAGLFDINTLSEDVFNPVFRELYQSPFLRNLNSERKNFPGLDLGDDCSRLAFQITSDGDIEKVKETLQKIIKHEHYRRYDTIYIYVLGQKQNRYRKKALLDITKGYFNFDPAKHILDSTDIVERCRQSNYDVVRNVEETLEVFFTNPKRYFLSASKPAETESLTIGLLPISFPDELFVGKVIFDRESVISESWNREFKLTHKATQRRVVQAALEQKGLKFSSAWVTRKNEIVTFHDLRDEGLPLSALVEPAIIDPLPVKRFIANGNGQPDTDAVNVIKDLLRATIQAQLWHRGITWQHEEQLFIFISKDKRIVNGKERIVEPRYEQWSRGTKEGRMVYRIKWWDDDPTKYWYHEHLAFAMSFEIYDGKWYMAVRPETFCSRNGYDKSKYHRNRTSFLKRKAHNLDVVDDMQFIVEILRKDQEKTLLAGTSKQLITFGQPITLAGAPLIDDKDWLQQEEKRKRNALENPPTAPLFEAL